MPGSLDTWIAIAGMAIVTYACRAGGFWAMRFVRLTPRVEGVLAAMPMAVIAALLARSLSESGWIEAAGVAVAFGLTRALSNDFVGMVAGVAAVAALRFVASS
jgi:uncharacterized membrane protein